MNQRHPIFDYAARMLQIFGILLRQLTRLSLRHFRHQPPDGHLLLREGFEMAGGSFIKMGQILSLQIDTLPRIYCDALLGLLDNVPTASAEQIQRVFEAEFQAGPDTLFESFNYTALASASIGQVHKATLHDGTSVAVKVQRPGVRYDFQRDVVLMNGMVHVIMFLGIKTLYFMRDAVRETGAWTQDELDYRREAANCNLLANNAQTSATERIPQIYWDLTTSRILTLEFLNGPSVSTYLKYVDRGDHAALNALRAEGFDPEIFSRNVISNFLSDTFRFGVFHADLHPANLLILPNNAVGYVDFGIVATLTPEARRKQIELTLAYATGSGDTIYGEFLNICTPTPDADLEGMRRKIGEMCKTWYDEPAPGGKARFRVSVTWAMMDLLSVAREYGVLVDREMIKYIRSTILVDGLIQRLAPGFDIADSLRKLVEDYLIEEARRRIFSTVGGLSMLTDLAIWLKTGPAGMLRALDLVERRQVHLRSNVEYVKDKDESLRARTVAAGAVWACSILFIALSGGLPSWRTAPFFVTITALFVTSWTLWMLLLLRRLSTR